MPKTFNNTVVDTVSELPKAPRRSSRVSQLPNRWIHESTEYRSAIALNAAEDIVEPTSYEDVVNSPQVSEWTKAIEDEMCSINKNQTWSLVQLPKGRRAIKNKWIFNLELNTDISIMKYKARLVAKGLTQKEGVDQWFSASYSQFLPKKNLPAGRCTILPQASHFADAYSCPSGRLTLAPGLSGGREMPNGTECVVCVEGKGAKYIK